MLISQLMGGFRGARARSGMSQEETADAVGIAAEVYGRIERGGLIPSLLTFRKICEALHVEPQVILGASKEPGAPKPGTKEHEATMRLVITRLAARVPNTARTRNLLRRLARAEPDHINVLHLMAATLNPKKKRSKKA